MASGLLPSLEKKWKTMKTYSHRCCCINLYLLMRSTQGFHTFYALLAATSIPFGPAQARASIKTNMLRL